MQPSSIIQVAVKIQVSSEPAPIAMFPKAGGTISEPFKGAFGSTYFDLFQLLDLIYLVNIAY